MVAGADDGHGGRVGGEGLGEFLLRLAQGFFGLFVLDGVADQAFQQQGVDFVLVQVQGGAGLHGFEVDFLAAAPGQQDQRGDIAAPDKLADQLDAAVQAQVVVDQHGIIVISG